MKRTAKRWLEAIAQNMVAALLFLGGTAIVIYLLSDAGNRLTVRVWWLAVGVFLLVGLFTWLLWLTAQVRDLRARPATGAPTAVGAASPRPHQALLDRMDAMIEQLLGYENHESVSWQTGQAYNDLMDEARAVDQTLNLKRLPVATEVAMYSGSPTTDLSPRDLAGGLRQARIQVARAND